MHHNHSAGGMSRKHMLIMLLCCLIPIAAIAVITLFDIPLSNVVFVLMLLLCPLSHFLLMRGMAGQHQDQGHQMNVVAEEAAPELTETAN